MEGNKISSIKEFIDKISYVYDDSMNFVIFDIFFKMFFSLFEERSDVLGSSDKEDIFELIDNNEIKKIILKDFPFFRQKDELERELMKVSDLHTFIQEPLFRVMILCNALFDRNKNFFKIVIRRVDKNINNFEIESLFEYLLDNDEKRIETKLDFLFNFINNIEKILKKEDETIKTIFKIIKNMYRCIYKSIKKEKYEENMGAIFTIFFTPNEKEDPKKVKDIIDNIKKIYNSFKEEHKYRIVFRALQKNNDKLNIKDEIPSLFNKKYTNLKEHEENIYYDFISSNPNEFNGMTTFDTLTKMRHYEVPNRLLDVTTDPLLALFFACGENDDGSKAVCIYSVKEEYVKNYDSDTITVLTMLAKLKKCHRETLKKIVDVFKKSNGRYCNSKDNISIKYKNEDKNIDEIKQIENLEIDKLEIKESTEGNVNVKALFNYLVSKFVDELNWKLKQENPGWREGLLDLETFTTCYLVKPKMNNPRIIAQSGAFFIYPFDDADITKSLYMNKYEICKIDSLNIKRELDLLNINETKYMPDDLTKYAKDIRKKYE